MDVMGGGDGEFLLEIGFIVGEREIFKVSLHSWQTPLFYEDNPYVAYPTFLKFCSPHTPASIPCQLQTHPHCSFCCPVSLTE